MAPSPRELFLAECRRYLGTKESPIGSNRGLRIDYWLTEVGSPLASPWCAAGIHQCGIQSVGRTRWPFKRSGRVQDIVDAAGELVTKDRAAAGPGDLLVIWYPSLNRYGHVAALELITRSHVTSLDGNSNADGSREGYAFVRKTRPLSDRFAFIRWPEVI